MARVHARAWSRSGLGGEIRYICTPRPGAPIEHAPAARTVTDLDLVLSDDSIEIVTIASPTPSHAEIAIRALGAGKNVLLEKPIALTLADALAIRQAASTSSGIIMVAQVVRFFPGYSMLRRALEDGSLGSVLSVRALRTSAHNPAASWIRDEALSGGMLVDFAIHDFDQLNLFLGTPRRVSARRSGENGPVETTVEYDGGRIGTGQSFMSLPMGTPLSSSLEVTGTAAIARYRYSSDPTDLPGIARAPTGVGISDYHLLSATGTGVVDVSGGDPFTLQAAYFLECVRSGEPPQYCPLDGAISALAVSLAARESLRSGSAVDVRAL